MIEKQSKPDSKNYRNLISEIEDGVIKIPKFQRDFVWSLEKTAELLDSIVKGYPIGTFILWQTQERLNDIKKLGKIDLPPAPENRDVEYVLDGQQRITSLFAAYRGAEIQKEGEKKTTNYKDIYVNLDELSAEKEDTIISTEPPTSGKYLPLYDVLKSKTTDFRKFQESGFTDDEINKIGSYQNVFETYNFSIILLKKHDIDAAIEVFTRINTSGQVLTLFEIMVAKTYDEEQEFDMQKKWEEFIKRLEDKKCEYETIPGIVLLQLLSLHLSKTKECKRKTILELDKQKIINTWDTAISAIEDAIHFFRTHYKIPASRLLPYNTLLVPFAYFFLKQDSGPTANQAKYLQDFFWRMALSERYSSATESKLAQDIRRIDSIIADKRPDYKEIRVQLDSPERLIEESFSAGSSYSKAVMCLLAAQGPEDFDTGAKVTLGNSWLKAAHSKNYHHFFPKAFLKKRKIPNDNSLMNITLVSDKLNKRTIGARAPSKYLPEFKKSNDRFEETMATHFIEVDDSWLTEDDYDAFLKMRAKTIFTELNKKMLADEE